MAILIATLSLPFLTHPLPARSAPPTGFPDTPLQDLLVRQWTLDDGLPTETLTDVLQTRDGFLWISTFEGLLRFDGHDFELFDKARIAAQRAETGALALQSDSFFSLDEDSDGGLWVSNQAGDVLHFSDDIFRIFPTPVEGDIRELWIDAPDNIWIAGQTLLHGDPRRALETVEISEDRSLGADSLLRHEGSLWIGSDHRGLIELRDDRNGADLHHRRRSRGQRRQLLGEKLRRGTLDRALGRPQPPGGRPHPDHSGDERHQHSSDDPRSELRSLDGDQQRPRPTAGPPASSNGSSRSTEARKRLIL